MSNIKTPEEKEHLITLIENRISNEHRKHPNLDWQKIAAIKIYETIAAQFQSNSDWDEIHEAFVTAMRIDKNKDIYQHLQDAFYWFKDRFKNKVEPKEGMKPCFCHLSIGQVFCDNRCAQSKERMKELPDNILEKVIKIMQEYDFKFKNNKGRERHFSQMKSFWMIAENVTKFIQSLSTQQSREFTLEDMQEYAKSYHNRLKQSQWISVEERLPETNCDVIVYSKRKRGKKVYCSFYYKENVKGAEFSGDSDVILWIPFPEPPIEFKAKENLKKCESCGKEFDIVMMFEGKQWFCESCFTK